MVLVVVAAARPAAAEDKTLYDRLWPEVPAGRHLTLSDQITEQLTLLGNLVGYHVDVLSADLIAMRVDARRRRAYVRIGAGDERVLRLRIASDIHFTEGLARVTTRIDLRIRGRNLELELPEAEVVPASYRGDRGVEIRVPLFRRRF